MSTPLSPPNEFDFIEIGFSPYDILNYPDISHDSGDMGTPFTFDSYYPNEPIGQATPDLSTSPNSISSENYAYTPLSIGSEGPSLSPASFINNDIQNAAGNMNSSCLLGLTDSFLCPLPYNLPKISVTPSDPTSSQNYYENGLNLYHQHSIPPSVLFSDDHQFLPTLGGDFSNSLGLGEEKMAYRETSGLTIQVDGQSSDSPYLSPISPFFEVPDSPLGLRRNRRASVSSSRFSPYLNLNIPESPPINQLHRMQLSDVSDLTPADITEGQIPADLVKAKVGSPAVIKASTSRRKREGRFHCSLCSQTFTAKHNREYHEKAHRGEKRYECEECGSKYTTPSVLVRHKRKHQLRS